MEAQNAPTPTVYKSTRKIEEIKAEIIKLGHVPSAKGRKSELIAELVSHLKSLGQPIPLYITQVSSNDLLQQSSAAPTTTSKRKVKPIQVIKGSGDQAWSLNKDEQRSSLMELVSFQNVHLGDYRKHVWELYDVAHKVTEDARKRHGPDVSMAMAIFGTVSNTLFRKVQDIYNDDHSPVSTQVFARTVGTQFKMNLINLPPRSSFSMVDFSGSDSGEPISKYNAEIHHDVAHGLRLLPRDILNKVDNGVYIHPCAIAAELKGVTEGMNRDIGILPKHMMQCVDDDLINATGKDIDNGEVASRRDKRKGNGFTLFTATSVATGAVTGLSVAGSGKSTSEELEKELSLLNGCVLGFDRGFTRLELVQHLFKARGVSAIGILAENIKSDHPAELHACAFSHLQNMDLTKISPNAVLSYDGCGPQVRMWNREGNIGAVSIINKTNQSSTGHIRFIVSGKLAKPELKSKFVRIAKSIGREERAKTLVESVKRKDGNAETLFRSLRDHLRIMTLTQGTADWFVLRLTGITATQAEIVLKPILRFLIGKNPEKYARLRAVLWKHGDCSVEEEPLSTPSPGSDAQALDLAESIVDASPTPALPEGQDEADSAPPSSFPEMDYSPESAATDAEEFQEDDIETVGPVSTTVLPGTETAPLSTDVAGTEDDTDDPVDELTEIQAGPATLEQTGHSVGSMSFEEMTFVRTLQDRLGDRLHIKKYPGNSDTRAGKLNESRVIVSLESQLDCIHGHKVYTIGLARSLKVPYIYDSKDGVCLIDLKKIRLDKIAHLDEIQQIIHSDLPTFLVPCGIEIKTSKHFKTDLSRAREVQVVVAGSPEFHAFDEMKGVFKMQMLHQAFVGNFSWNMLAAWSPMGPAVNILVYYPTEVLQEYEALVNEQMVRCFYSWLHENASVVPSCGTNGGDAVGSSSHEGGTGGTDVTGPGAGTAVLSDKELISKIPAFFSKGAKTLLSSHVGLLRAVFEYSEGLNELYPMEPTHAFRTAFITIYDIIKGATDVECRAIADAWKGMSEKLQNSTKLTWRLLYSAAILTVKTVQLVEYLDSIGGKGNAELPDSVYAFRHAVHRRESTNEGLDKLGSLLQRSELPFGNFKSVSKLYVMKTPKAKTVERVEVCGKYPDELFSVLAHRAKSGDRTIERVDFFTNTAIPVTESSRSPNTPGAWCFKDSYAQVLGPQLVKAFNGIPPWNTSRELRMMFWCSDGLQLRMNPFILHHPLELSNRGLCFWCQRVPQIAYTCAFCGEVLCKLDCFHAFHHSMQGFQDDSHEEDMPPAAGETTVLIGESSLSNGESCLGVQRRLAFLRTTTPAETKGTAKDRGTRKAGTTAKAKDTAKGTAKAKGPGKGTAGTTTECSGPSTAATSASATATVTAMATTPAPALALTPATAATTTMKGTWRKRMRES